MKMSYELSVISYELRVTSYELGIKRYALPVLHSPAMRDEGWMRFALCVTWLKAGGYHG